MLTSAVTINATGRSKKLLLKRVERILNKKTSRSALNQKLVAYLCSAFLIGLIAFYNPGQVIVETIETVHTASKMPGIGTEQVGYIIPASTTSDDNIKTKEVTARKKDQVRSVKSKDKSAPEAATEEIIEWIADTNPQELKEEFFPALTSHFASDAQTRDFSIPEKAIPVQPDYSVEVHPYVPSTSFSYQFVEDTALPKKYVLTQADIKAKETMTGAIKALHEIDWQKLEKAMEAAGKKIDVIKLQQELTKAMSDVDWKKINDEMQSTSMQEENNLLKEHKELQVELKKFQHEYRTRSAEQKRIHEAIIQERLCEKDIRKAKPVKQKVSSKKKIVYI